VNTRDIAFCEVQTIYPDYRGFAIFKETDGFSFAKGYFNESGFTEKECYDRIDEILDGENR